jgi:hypothetical protein
MRWNFHGLTIECAAPEAAVRERWQADFASCRAASADAGRDIVFELEETACVPERPAGEPRFRQGDLLEYTLDGRVWVAHFPRFGQLRLDLANGVTEGRIVQAALEAYGVFEDLIAIGLSPHLRRRGLFLIHAFAAAHNGRAALLIGGIASGKTTTGMALLAAGWKLLSNDSPVIDAAPQALSYPGLLAAYPDTLARFAATARLAQSAPEAGGRHKLMVAAERVWPDVWIERAACGLILFPQIEPRPHHAIEPISRPEALRRLLPHAVEQWDSEMIPEHLRILRQLVEAAPAYVLRLGPDVQAIPALLEKALRDTDRPSQVTDY